MKVLTGLVFFCLFAMAGCWAESDASSVKMRMPLPLGSSVNTLDPAQASSGAELTELSNAYESLYQYHFEKRPYLITPGLALALPETFANGKRIRVRLKDKVFFQVDDCFKNSAGKRRVVTAQDFVYSWRRVIDSKQETLARFFLTHWVRSFKAIDAQTLEIELTQAMPRLTEYLALPALAVVPREAVEKYGKEFGRHTVGTGAFKLASARWGRSLTWERNEAYHGPGLPRVQRIEMVQFSDSGKMKREFLDGKLDSLPVSMEDLREFVTPAKELVASLREKGISLEKANGFDVTFLALNFRRDIVRNSRDFRQALALALDPDKLNELFWVSSAVVAQSPISPPMEEYDPGHINPMRKFNLTKAKALLRRSGFVQKEGKPELTLVTASDPGSVQLGEFVRLAWAALGVNLTVSAMAPTEYPTALREKRGDVWSLAWTAEMPSAEGSLALLYGPAGDFGLGLGRYSSSVYDKTYRRLVGALAKDRRAVANELANLIDIDSPWVFGVHRIHFRLVQPWVKSKIHHDFAYGAAKYYDAQAKP